MTDKQCRDKLVGLLSCSWIQLEVEDGRLICAVDDAGKIVPTKTLEVEHEAV